jgi:hypothetical protein
MENMMVRNLIPLLFLAISPLAAGEGVIVIQKQDDLDSGSSSTQKLYIESDTVAIHSEGGDGRMGFVYFADSGLLRMIDHGNRTYREMTEQQIEQLMGGVQDQMAKVREQMAEQLKNMTPEQRAMMEKMLGGGAAQVGAAPAVPHVEKTAFRRGDGSAEIGGRSCDWYEGYRSENLVSMVCAADWSTFDLRPSDFTVFQRLAGFLSRLAPQMGDQLNFGAEDWAERESFPGVPLEQKTFRGGKPAAVSTMESAERGQAIDPAVYEPPAGYQKQAGLQ